jgi:hypothetical protein
MTGVDTTDILMPENEQAHVVSQVDDSRQDKLIDDMAVM